MKKCWMLLLSLVSFSVFSCPRALPTNDPGFCISFKSVATCYCTDSGLPEGMCQDTNALYLQMIAVYGSLDKACKAQHYTTKQDCLDNWNCYLKGGIDSNGKTCSSTGNSCL